MAPVKEENDSGTGNCMNMLCRRLASAPACYLKGWPLRSGGFASLCSDCGFAYEKSTFCEIFHGNDSGWRKCSVCGKNLHCGCVASQLQIELLDHGGVCCIVCFWGCENASDRCHDKFRRRGTFATPVDDKFNPERACSHANIRTETESQTSERFRSNNPGVPFAPRNIREVDGDSDSKGFSVFKSSVREVTPSTRDFCESLVQTALNTTLCSFGNFDSFCRRTGSETSSPLIEADFRCPQDNRKRHLHPKLPKSVRSTGPKAREDLATQIRHARSPADGKGRNQLLPRYWPRITDQELQQLSEDSNAIIVPLFEKVLSASDAGRSGRLVLPKACAEAYMPPIYQPEGIPLRIQDVHGKEWVFQFRFWPNNNSRMYVLEGVTPCIQSMQLEAGDTVIFSRIDPEGKLMIGLRKASNANSSKRDSQASSTAKGSHHVLPVAAESLFQPTKNGADSTVASNENGPLQSPEKATQNFSSSKRKLSREHNLDALELELTIEEAQGMLRSPPSAKPSILTIEGYDFEEYDVGPEDTKPAFQNLRYSGNEASLLHKIMRKVMFQPTLATSTRGMLETEAMGSL